MASIIDQVWQGIIPTSSNVALNRLADVFGTTLIAGTSNSPATTLITTVSVALTPIYIALLVLIVAYIFISGTYRTASEGTFLGRQWSSFMVPGMIIACIMLLSPIPSKNGIAMGQYIFIRGLMFGSNMADYALKSAFTSSAQNAANESYDKSPEYIKQVNSQLKTTLPLYLCAQQLSAMGYGSRSNFFALLNTVCKIPTQNLDFHKKYYLLDPSINPGYRANQEAATATIRSSLGIDMPSPITYTTTNIDNALNAKTPSGKEMYCYFKAFNDNLIVPNNNILTEIGSPGLSAIEAISGIPQHITNVQLELRDLQLHASWGYALKDAYQCVKNNVIQNLQENYTTTANNREPWRDGWVYSGKAIQDSLQDYTNAIRSSITKFPLNNTPVEPGLLKDTLQDRANSKMLETNLHLLNVLLNSENSKIDTVSDTYGQYYSNKKNNVMTSNLTMERVLANVIIGMDARAIANATTAAQSAAQAAAQAAGQTLSPGELAKVGIKPSMLHNFLDTFIGKAGSVTGAAAGAANYNTQKLGWMSKKFGAFAAKFNSLLQATEKIKKSAQVASDAAGSIPILGAVAKLGIGAASALLMPGEFQMGILTMAVTAMNVIVLLPQVILIIVLMLWLARAAVWFLIIPLATVIIALPDTRAGHDIWKSALAIILTPLLAVLFYIVALGINDILYEVVLMWLIEPLIGNGLLMGVINLVIAFATGEAIFRILVAAGLLIAVTLFLMFMILKGPDLVTRSLGLSSSSGDLGTDLTDIRGRLLDSQMRLSRHG